MILNIYLENFKQWSIDSKQYIHEYLHSFCRTLSQWYLKLLNQQDFQIMLSQLIYRFFFINFVNSNTIAGNLILHIGNYLPNFLILSDTYIVGKLQIPVVLLGSRWSVNNPISLRVLGFMKEESLIQV